MGQDAGVIGLDLHKCRRTYGQYLLDEGASLETVSVLYGHLETSTTERSYCRKKQDMAVKAARDIWAGGVQSQTPSHPAGAEKPPIDFKNGALDMLKGAGAGIRTRASSLGSLSPNH